METINKQDRVSTRVSLVVTLIDDFTGRMITDTSVRVFIDGQKPPVKKSEGYRVFTNLPEGEYEVCAEGGVFEPARVTAEAGFSAEGGAYRSVRIRMTPGRGYSLPSDATRIEGTAEPGSSVRIICREGAGVIKLLYDYFPKSKKGDAELAGGEKIALFITDGADLGGKMLYIEDGARKNSEFFRVLQKDAEGGVYTLEKPLGTEYKKIGTTIYPVYGAAANSLGSFFIPIAGLRLKECEFECTAVGERTVSVKKTLAAGSVHRLDMSGGKGE